MRYIVTINNKNYEVEVEKGQASVVRVEDIPVTAAVQETKSPESPSPADTKVSIGKGRPITAPMPGTILNVKVSKGQRVKMGETIFILEAMKLENEITAPEDGEIVEIVATNGSTVSTGDILAIIQ